MRTTSGNSGTPFASRTIALAEAEGVPPSVYSYAVSAAPHQDRAGGGTAHYGKEVKSIRIALPGSHLMDCLVQTLHIKLHSNRANEEKTNETHTKKTNGMKKRMFLLPVFLVAVVALVLGAFAPELWAHGNKKTIELDEAEVFIEYNSTDGDFGIQFFWDGEPWKWMIVKNERRRPVLSVWANKNVKAQGLTEGFFESAEPTLEELPFQEFLDRFPEGDYTFRGRTLDRKWIVGEAELTHYIPCPPLVGRIGGPGTLAVGWRPVTTVVDPDEEIPDPEEGSPTCIAASEDFEIVAYEAVFEMEALVGEDDEEELEERVFVDTATLPADATSFTASPEFVSAAAAFRAAGKLLVLKVEVIAIEASGNKTITELVLFELEEEDEE